MITLITGLPGACKTLYTLSSVKAMAEKDNRPVFYAGIKDLMLPWTEIDATKWHECPPGAIIVIDEAQTIFRPRSFGSNVPDYVAELETHRHKGHDLYVITQHPLLMDTNVRRLVGRHIHIVRKFGFQLSTLHEWASVRENCDKPAGRTDSLKKEWSFDKKAFEYYKSAEVHTVKKRLPGRLIFLILLVTVILPALGYRVYNNIMDKQKVQPVVKADGTPVSGAVMGAGDGRAVFDPAADAIAFVQSNTPRVSGLQYTAPKYDGLTAAKYVPVPAMCVRSEKRCTCYSQQGTILDVTTPQCADFVLRGYFAEFDAPTPWENGVGDLARQNTLPSEPVQPSQVASNGAVMPDLTDRQRLKH